MAYPDITAAGERLRGIAHRTPVAVSSAFDRAASAQVFFKCELFQRTGSFKFRGAYNACASLDTKDRARGVLTYSSGNHAQALALACQLLKIPAVVVMPDDAPAVKLAATAGYGAEVIRYDRAETTREILGAQIAGERELPIVPPYDHPNVVAGQGTAADELLAEVPDLDFILVPCGGGGLLSGTAIAAEGRGAGCRVIGVEPQMADDATRSFRTGVLHRVENPTTIADGARTPSLGEITFPIVRALVHDMVTVPDEAIIDAMQYIWQRMKLVVEPTGALAAAALLCRAVDTKGARVGVVLSGGNVDLPPAAESRGTGSWM